MRYPLLSLAALILLALPRLTAAQPIPDADLIAKVDAIAAKALAEPGAVGLSIAVAREGKVILSKGYGLADAELSVPAGPDSMFRIGSVTKQFTAAAVMKLVEQGKLSLDDTIQKHLPDFPVKEHPVTVRHLLTHTSGIWNYTEDDKFMERDASLELTPGQLVATFKDKPLEFEPGAKFNYSNSAYYLLGEIIAKASGKPYAQFVQSELFEPLGLAHTRHENNSTIIPGRAQGYSLVDGKLANDKPIGADVPGAAGSLLSTAGDLVRWQLALAAGKIVKPESYTQMSTSALLKDGKPTGYGFGLGVSDWEGRPRISHGGGIFGFTSMLLNLPKDNLTIAVISNCDSFNSGKVADSIARAALGIKDFVPKDLPVPTEDLKRFAGKFAFESIPLELRFFDRDGQLWIEPSGQKENRLLFQGNGEFRASFDPQVKLIFESPADKNAPPESVTLHQGGRTMTAKRKS